jgi:hypothetical protein
MAFIVKRDGQGIPVSSVNILTIYFANRIAEMFQKQTNSYFNNFDNDDNEYKLIWDSSTNSWLLTGYGPIIATNLTSDSTTIPTSGWIYTTGSGVPIVIRPYSATAPDGSGPLPARSIIIKKNTTFKIPRTGSGAPILWKIAIFGAGTAISNGEYVWDGITTENGLPVYRFSFEVVDIIFGIDNYWHIYSSSNDTNYYKSLDLITWTIENGDSPVPTSTLSYSQTSFINSIYFGFDAQDDFLDCTVSRSSGGTSQFSNGPDILVTWNSGDAKWEGTLYGTRFYWSYDLFYWYNDDDSPAVASLIAGMTYSA